MIINFYKHTCMSKVLNLMMISCSSCLGSHQLMEGVVEEEEEDNPERREAITSTVHALTDLRGGSLWSHYTVLHISSVSHYTILYSTAGVS